MVYAQRTGSSAEKRRYMQGWWARKLPIVQSYKTPTKKKKKGNPVMGEEEGKRSDGRQI
jgi:hypothetical protein